MPKPATTTSSATPRPTRIRSRSGAWSRSKSRGPICRTPSTGRSTHRSNEGAEEVVGPLAPARPPRGEARRPGRCRRLLGGFEGGFHPADGFAQVLLVHLNPDEIQAQAGGRDRGRSQSDERIQHGAGALEPVQPEALLRALWAETRPGADDPYRASGSCRRG